MSERILYPEAHMDHYDGVLAVADLPDGDVNSQKRLRECVEDILVPASGRHGFAVLQRTAVDQEKVCLREDMYPVKPGANSAQIHIHPYPIEFSCPEGSATSSIMMDTLDGASALLKTLESDGERHARDLMMRESAATLFVTEALQNLRASLVDLKGLSAENRLKSARAAFTMMYMLCTERISPDESELYAFLRHVQQSVSASWHVSWQDYAYGVMDTNVTHARSVLAGDTRTGPGLFVLSRRKPEGDH